MYHCSQCSSPGWPRWPVAVQKGRRGQRGWSLMVPSSYSLQIQLWKDRIYEWCCFVYLGHSMEKFTRISSISEQHSADSHHMARSYAPPSYGPMVMPIHPLLNHGDSEGISMRVWDYHCCGARKIRCPVIQEPFDFVLSILASAFVSAAVRHSFKKEPPTNLRLETQDIPYISYTYPIHVP